jgi:hypothetical protein
VRGAAFEVIIPAVAVERVVSRLAEEPVAAVDHVASPPSMFILDLYRMEFTLEVEQHGS